MTGAAKAGYALQPAGNVVGAVTEQLGDWPYSPGGHVLENPQYTGAGGGGVTTGGGFLMTGGGHFTGFCGVEMQLIG
jgi:hypothetical protein